MVFISGRCFIAFIVTYIMCICRDSTGRSDRTGNGKTKMSQEQMKSGTVESSQGNLESRESSSSDSKSSYVARQERSASGLDISKVQELTSRPSSKDQNNHVSANASDHSSVLSSHPSGTVEADSSDEQRVDSSSPLQSHSCDGPIKQSQLELDDIPHQLLQVHHENMVKKVGLQSVTRTCKNYGKRGVTTI